MPGCPGGSNPEAFADFSDILGDFFGFGDLFGGGGGGRNADRPSAAKTSITTWRSPSKRPCFGIDADIQVPRMEALRPL